MASIHIYEEPRLCMVCVNHVKFSDYLNLVTEKISHLFCKMITHDSACVWHMISWFYSIFLQQINKKNQMKINVLVVLHSIILLVHDAAKFINYITRTINKMITVCMVES